MAAPGGYSYKPNVNRVVTKKWKEAHQASYDGDDWGDDGRNEREDEQELMSAPPTNQPPWLPSQIDPSKRSFTNPMPARTGQRPSFDRGDERRFFSGSGFETAYPTAQRNPFPEPQHDFEPPRPGSRGANQPPLSIQTQGTPPQSGFRPGSRGQNSSSYQDGSYGSPGGYPRQRSMSNSRNAQTDPYQRHESPIRPDSRSSNRSGYGPPRKTTLNQQQAPLELPHLVQNSAQQSSASQDAAAAAAPGEVKPLPFIRPADIYKRLEEEREKERRSQESSRPSLDTLNRPRDSSADGRPTSSEQNDESPSKDEPSQETDAGRRLKPTLDTVVERKSEYGFDNILKNAGESTSPTSRDVSDVQGVARQDTNASSIYTNRQDPVSAASLSRNESVQHYPLSPQDVQSAISEGSDLPALDRVGAFGEDFSHLTSSPSAQNAPNFVPAQIEPPEIAPPIPDKGTNAFESVALAPGHSREVQAIKEASLPPPSRTQETVPKPEAPPYAPPKDSTAIPSAVSGSNREQVAGAVEIAGRSQEPTKQPLQAQGIVPPPLSTTATNTVTQKSPIAGSIPPSEPEENVSTIVKSTGPQNTITAPFNESMRQQPPAGFNSVVKQAFEQSEQENPLSPVSGARISTRSSTGNTADISPVITRKADSSIAPQGKSFAPESNTQENATPRSEQTAGVSQANKNPIGEKALPAPPVVQQDYRKDNSPPTVEQAPSRRPLSVNIAVEPQPQKAEMISASTARSFTIEHPDEVTSPVQTNLGEKQADIATTSPLRSTSEEWQEWQAHRKQFNTKFGFQDSNPTTPGAPSPGIPSPISRSETPAKGKVRELAGKLERQNSTSAVSSPISLTTPVVEPSQELQPVERQISDSPISERQMPEQQISEPQRPVHEARLNSFRPPIPGGWQSSTGTPMNEDIPQVAGGNLQPPHMQSRFDSSESIPTAKAPVQHNDSNDDTQKKAFAAAAAAGSALAGIFSGAALTHAGQSDSEFDSERETNGSRNEPPDTSDTRDFAQMQQTGYTVSRQTDEDKAGPTPVQNTYAGPNPPVAATAPFNAGGTSGGILEGRESDEKAGEAYADYPAPLRTSRIGDASTPTRSSMPNMMAFNDTDSPKDSEKLTQEIEKSLTPEPSREEPSREENIVSQQHAAPISVMSPPTAPGIANTSLQQQAGHGYPSRGLDISSSQREQPSPMAPMPYAVTQRPRPSIDTNVPAEPRRPFIDHRFSWEKEVEQETQPSQPALPQPGVPTQSIQPPPPQPVAVDTNNKPPETPPKDTAVTLPTGRRDTAQSESAGKEILPQPDVAVLSNKQPGASALEVAQQQRLMQPLTFQTILGYGTPAERIKAFDDTRNVYVSSDGNLNNWLQAMRSQHDSDPVLPQSLSPSIGKKLDASGRYNGSLGNTVETSQSRDDTPLRGTKLMQEDTKRVMAAAGRLSGKAGIAAKGLFSKGKDKLRNASAGDKGNRRSVGSVPEVHEPQSRPELSQIQPPSQKRTSQVFVPPPQLPPSLLSISPVDVDDWALPYSSDDRQQQPTTTIPSSSQFAKDVSSDRQVNDSRFESLRTTKDHDGVALPSRDDHESVSAINTVIGESRDQYRSDNQTTKAQGVQPLKEVPDRTVIEPTGEQSANHVERRSVSPTKPETSTPKLNTPNDSERIAAQSPGRHLSPPDSTANPQADSSGNMEEVGTSGTRNTNRLSVISNISSASRSPDVQNEELDVHRSVSPEVSQTKAERAPPYEPEPEPETKEEEASKDLPASEQAEALPLYEHNNREEGADRKSRNLAEANIVPVADLSEHREIESQSQQSRRFSFAGNENLARSTQPLAQTADLPDETQQPPSPISQTYSKALSQISLDDTDGDRSNYGGPQGKGGVPFRGIHHTRGSSSIGASDEPSRIQSTESPLPSARRPLEEIERLRQRGSPSVQPPSVPPPVVENHIEDQEGRYRIPGPYHQEFRSPKPVAAAPRLLSNSQSEAGTRFPQLQTYSHETQRQPSYDIPPLRQTDGQFQQVNQQQLQPSPSGPQQLIQHSSQQVSPQRMQSPRQPQPLQSPSQQPSQWSSQQSIPSSQQDWQRGSQMQQQFQQQMMPPPNRTPQRAPTQAFSDSVSPGQSPEQAKTKHRGFGAMFRGRTKSPSRQMGTMQYDQGIDGGENKKRSSLFRRNSRQNSIRSQKSSINETRDRVGQLPSPDQAGSSKRHSQSFFKAFPSSTTNDSPSPAEGKKKRFSGLFSKGSKLEKLDKANQMLAQQQNVSPHNVSYGNSHLNQYQQPTSPLGQSQSKINGHQLNGQFRGGSVGGYQGPDGQQPYHQEYVQQQSPPPQQQRQTPQQQPTQTQHPYPQGPHLQEQHYGSGFVQPQGQPQESFSRTSSQFETQNTALNQQFTNNQFEQRPTDLKIDTNAYGRSNPNLPATAPPQTRANRDISYQSRAYVPPSARPASSTDTKTDHVRDLHTRSRSPKLGRKSSDEDLASGKRKDKDYLNNPASTLGTFTSKRISPVGGIPRPAEDQEKPYLINIPGEPSEEEKRRRSAKQKLIEQSGSQKATSPTNSKTSAGSDQGRTVAERLIGPQIRDSTAPSSTARAPVHSGTTHPSSPGGTAGGPKHFVAELPGSKAAGYESEEEIPMSATAYPGQAWEPIFIGDGRWDD